MLSRVFNQLLIGQINIQELILPHVQHGLSLRTGKPDPSEEAISRGGRLSTDDRSIECPSRGHRRRESTGSDCSGNRSDVSKPEGTPIPGLVQAESRLARLIQLTFRVRLAAPSEKLIHKLLATFE